MKYILFQLLLTSILFTFDIDDWTYFKKAGHIHSIIEDDEFVHFITNNGIYSYDDMEDHYYYNFNLSNMIDFNNTIYHFHFDSNTSMYWFIDDYSIKMKHSFHGFWDDISFRKLDIMSVHQIIDIGSSPNYIWIKLFDRIVPLNQITGIVSTDDIDRFEIDNIKWSNNNTDYNGKHNIDLSNYVIFDDWNIGYDKITNHKGDVLVPTILMEDKNSNIWVGTKQGNILKGSAYSHRLEVINFGLKFNNVTTAIIDSNMNWWFGDSQFLRTGVERHRESFRKNNYHFIAKWNEYEDNWKYIETDYSMLIQNIDVNDLLFINDLLYIGTMDGLLIFDENDNSWVKVDKNLNDRAIWDIEYDNNSIYIATSNGYNEISSISHSVIDNNDNLSNLLSNTEIYDILISDNIMYIASERGLFEKYFSINNYKLLSDKQFRNIDKYKNNIFGNDEDMWEINLTTLKTEKIAKSVINFSISTDYLWMNHINYCELLDIDTHRSWKFSTDEGIPGSTIYNIKSNNDKVWFMTNDGIAIYNWDITDYE